MVNNLRFLGLSLLVLTLSYGYAFSQTGRMQCPQGQSFGQKQSGAHKQCPEGQVYDFRAKACVSDDQNGQNQRQNNQAPDQDS